MWFWVYVWIFFSSSSFPQIHYHHTSLLCLHVPLLLKLNETPRTPASVSRIQHSSVFPSPFSRPPLSATKVRHHTHHTHSLLATLIQAGPLVGTQVSVCTNMSIIMYDMYTHFHGLGFYCCLLYSISCVAIVNFYYYYYYFPKKKMLVSFCNEGQAAQSILLVFKSMLKLTVIFSHFECRLTECYCWFSLFNLVARHNVCHSHLPVDNDVYNIHLSSFNVVWSSVKVVLLTQILVW